MADIVPAAPPASPRAAQPGWTSPASSRSGLLLGVAAAVAAAIWLVMWSQGQNYTVLYGHLSERESGQVMDALTAAGIEFKLNPSGAVSVPESKIQEARIRLATQGLPQSDSMGVEMIQKESALGSSSLMESARYQSVLETELARTIVQGSGGGRRQGVHPRAPEAERVRARQPQGDRLGDGAALSGAPARSRPGGGNRAPGGLERAGALGKRRHAGRPGRLLAELARGERRERGHHARVRVHPEARAELPAADHRPPRSPSSGRGGRGQPSPPTWISR